MEFLWLGEGNGFAFVFWDFESTVESYSCFPSVRTWMSARDANQGRNLCRSQGSVMVCVRCLSYSRHCLVPEC